MRTLIYSSFGQSLTGIRENVRRMHAVGAPVRARLIVVYTISAALAGLAGGLFAQTTGYVNLAVLGLERAAGVMIILILGGYGRLYGAIIGAIAYMVLEHLLAGERLGDAVELDHRAHTIACLRQRVTRRSTVRRIPYSRTAIAAPNSSVQASTPAPM